MSWIIPRLVLSRVYFLVYVYLDKYLCVYWVSLRPKIESGLIKGLVYCTSPWVKLQLSTQNYQLKVLFVLEKSV